jgi:hypothetical protein
MWFNILKREAEVIYTEDTLKEAGGVSAFIGGKRNTPIIGKPIHRRKKRGKKREEEY